MWRSSQILNISGALYWAAHAPILSCTCSKGEISKRFETKTASRAVTIWFVRKKLVRFRSKFKESALCPNGNFYPVLLCERKWPFVLFWKNFEHGEGIVKNISNKCIYHYRNPRWGNLFFRDSSRILFGLFWDYTIV